MGVQANKRYPATVLSASLTESANSTPGLCIAFETPDGQIEDTFWLTPKTAERIAKDMAVLGADPDKLKSWAYIENIGTVISGAECDITTTEEEYKGKKRVRVQWINERRKPASGKASQRAAALFGGPKQTEPQPAAKMATDIEDDVPF